MCIVNKRGTILLRYEVCDYVCDHGRGEAEPLVLSMIFGVSKFESRLALFYFARKSSSHAGSRGFLYSPKVLDLCWTEHLQSRLPIRELPLRSRKCPADAAVLLRDGKK